MLEVDVMGAESLSPALLLGHHYTQHNNLSLLLIRLTISSQFDQSKEQVPTMIQPVKADLVKRLQLLPGRTILLLKRFYVTGIHKTLLTRLYCIYTE
jgi:hypothetical protein